MQAGGQRRAEPRHYGEALTEEEVMECIREQDERRKERAAKKGKAGGKKKTHTNGRQAGKGKKTNEDENICQGCEGHFDDDDEESQEAWIGCDERGCWRWFHYWCAGQLDVPDPKLKWICPVCTATENS